ncbi:hypothetical protein LH453_02600 [Laribacter hongkongensis]|nr:hypothetical protein [Laribacter hongkongensis]
MRIFVRHPVEMGRVSCNSLRVSRAPDQPVSMQNTGQRASQVRFPEPDRKRANPEGRSSDPARQPWRQASAVPSEASNTHDAVLTGTLADEGLVCLAGNPSSFQIHSTMLS